MFAQRTKIARRALLAATGALAVIGSAGAANAETLKFLIPWTSANESNAKTADAIMKAVKEASNGRLEFKLFGPAVVPPFQQLQPVSSGAFDVHYTSTAYHAKETGIGQLGDTVIRDPEKRRSSGYWDAVDKHYQTKHNLKIIGNAGSTGYQIILKEPVGPDGGLAGRKIRSNPAYDGIVRALSGTPVLLPPTQIYPALQKGLVDGAAWTVHSIESNKFHEVAKYLARPEFAVSTNLLVVNLDKWKKLSPEDQKALLEVGRKFETIAYEIPAAIQKRDEEFMKKNAGGFTQFGEKYAKQINKIYNEGIWNQIIRQHGDEARAIVDLIKEKNIAHQ